MGKEKRGASCSSIRRRKKPGDVYIYLPAAGTMKRLLTNCQVDEEARTVRVPRSSPPPLPPPRSQQLIRFEARPGTLSLAFECARFPTLIPAKPLQLM